MYHLLLFHSLTLKHGREKGKRKTENDVTGLNDERGLQEVEVESWISW